MFYLILLAWVALWTGLVWIGLDQVLWGGLHWMGLFVIGSFGCVFGMLKALFD